MTKNNSRGKFIVAHCGDVTVRGRHDPKWSTFNAKVYQGECLVSEQVTFLNKPKDVSAILSAVKGAIAFAIEDGHLTEGALKFKGPSRWDVKLGERR